MRILKIETQEAKVSKLFDYEESEWFTEAEKAALAYVEVVLKQGKTDQHTFDRLKDSFSEEAIIDITWVCATEVYLNTMNKALDIESDGLCER